MRALLLAAGLGTRLQPVTELLPKCLVPVQGKSLLEIWLSTLVDEVGITDILVNLHCKSALVTDLLKAGPYRDYVRLDYEDQLLGTAGTLLKHINEFLDEPLLLIHADNVSVADWPAFIAAYENRTDDVLMTMMTFTTDQPSNCGIVELDEQQRLLAFHEKTAEPPGNHANAAIYILSPQLLQQLHAAKELADFSTQVIPSLLGRINCWHNESYHRDIGNIDSLLAAQFEVELSVERAFVNLDNRWWQSYWKPQHKHHLLMLGQAVAQGRNGCCRVWDLSSANLAETVALDDVLVIEQLNHDVLCQWLDSSVFSLRDKIILVGEGDIRCHELYCQYGVICLLACRSSVLLTG